MENHRKSPADSARQRQIQRIVADVIALLPLLRAGQPNPQFDGKSWRQWSATTCATGRRRSAHASPTIRRPTQCHLAPVPEHCTNPRRHGIEAPAAPCIAGTDDDTPRRRSGYPP
nr:hypothetical protein [Edwardsiella ictaluri]